MHVHVDPPTAADPSVDHDLELEITVAGLRRPFERAIRASGVLVLSALLLPAASDGARGVPLYELLEPRAAVQITIAAVLAALALIALAETPALAARVKAAAALAATIALCAVLVREPELERALLPYVPRAMAQGVLLFAAVLAFGGAALLSAIGQRVRSTAGVLLAIAAAFAFALFVWPHRTGTLAESTLADVAIAFSGQGSTARLGIARTAMIVGALPIWLTAFIGWRVLLAPRAHAADVAWLFAIPLGVVLTLATKSAVANRADVHALIGARAVLLLLALVLAGAFAIHALLSGVRVPARDRLRVRTMIGPSAAVLSLVVAFAPRGGGEVERWPLGDPPEWAARVYRERLPALGDAANARDDLERATVLAVLDASPEPELASAIAELGALLSDAEQNRRAIARAQRNVNEAARRAGIPYFLDVTVMRQREAGASITWTYVLTYRVVRQRIAQCEGDPFESLWLERADGAAIVEHRLGWKRPGEARGLVVLDTIRHRWRYELAPAVRSDRSARLARKNAYARYGDLVRSDLIERIAKREGLPIDEAAFELDALLECVAAAEADDACTSLIERLEPELVEMLAINVEAHELQHVLDDGEVRIPRALARAVPAATDDQLKGAAFELSAYLGEVGRAEEPRLALLDLLAFAVRAPESTEGLAARVALDALAFRGETRDELVHLPGRELSLRARTAYQRLFSTEFIELIRPIETSDVMRTTLLACDR
jgi:hypothetical protein